MWSARQARLLAPLTLAALVAGCGGAYSKSDFIARADAICASSLRQTRVIAPGTALPTYLDELLAIVQSETAQLRALKRPPGSAHDRATLNGYFAALAQDVENYRALAAAAKRGDQQTVSSLEAALGASPSDSLAASYGLRSCSTPGSTAV